jgi:uncharacterized protein (DUF2236 family)
VTVGREDLEAMLAALRAEIPDPRAGLCGPGSITWQVNREAVILLGGGRAALLQLAHPFVAHAIDQHSATKSDPIGRFRRTFQHVFAMVFGDLEHAEEHARRVHAVHARIRGAIDEHVGPHARGARYAANDEAALFWVQATLIDTALLVHEQFVRPLTEHERERYYAESRRFARLFGIPDRVMPGDCAAFRSYMDAMLHGTTLAVGRPALELRRFLLQPPRAVHRPMTAWYRAYTASLLSPRLRAAFELPFGRREQLALAATVPAVRAAVRRLPKRLRYFPDYVEAMRRIEGKPARDPIGRALERLALEAIRPDPSLLTPRRS